jgi:hypothetical protein
LSALVVLVRRDSAKTIDAADRNFLVTIIASKSGTNDLKIAEFATRHHTEQTVVSSASQAFQT